MDETSRQPSLATRWARFAARWADGFLYATVYLVPKIFEPARVIQHDWTIQGLDLYLPSWASVGGLLAFQTYLLATRAQTIGKIVMNIRIVDHENGTHPGFGRIVLVRAVLPIVLGSVGGLFALIDPLFIFGEKRRCLHDRLARTTVVKVDGCVIDPAVFE